MSNSIISLITNIQAILVTSMASIYKTIYKTSY